VTAFFFGLDREIEKVNAFFVYKRAEMERRLKILGDKYRALTQPTTVMTPASLMDGEDFEELTPDPAAELGLFNSLLETKEALHKVLRYARLNTDAVSKILKKYLIWYVDIDLKTDSTRRLESRRAKRFWPKN
jgi:glycerophosphodiester phosphodiesterase